MDLDEEPSPWQLEKLLLGWSEAGGNMPSTGDPRDGALLSKFKSTEPDYVLGSFRQHFRDLLSAIPEDDPLKASVQLEVSLPRLEDEPFVVQEIPGKGMGVVVTRPIPAGSIVLKDPFVLSVEEPARIPETEVDPDDLMKSALLQLLEQYSQLPIDARRQFAGLHAHVKPEVRNWFHSQSRSSQVDVTEAELDFCIRLYCTFNTNEFDKVMAEDAWDWKIRSLFLRTSRINHSCQPNTRSTQTTDGHKVVTALRDIEPGEELTLKYMDHRPYSRRDWEAVTEQSWGFVCSCPGCRSK